MKSMTGYGRAEYNQNGIYLLVEIKTVNNRNLDLNCKTPRAFIAFDDSIRKAVSQKIKRGRADLFLTFIDKRDALTELDVDIEKAKSYYKASCLIAEKLSLPNDITVSQIMMSPDVISDNSLTDVTEFENILIDLVNKACDNLNAMRAIEGEKLVIDMLSRVDFIKETVDKVSLRAPKVALEYKEKLKNRIEEALKDIKYDETRLLNEVAFFTDKANIDEEITRLYSHISQFKEIVKIEGTGKKLDFLVQEFNREANTICSKSNDIEVTSLGLTLKNEIEKIREQVQNLE